MTVWAQVVSLPSLTLSAAVQALVAIKLFPAYYGSQNHLAFWGVVFAVNYSFGAAFWLFIYPRLFSPFRYIRGPRELVSPSHKTLLVKDGPSGEIFVDIARRYPGQDFVCLNKTATALLVTNPRLLADVLVHRCYDFGKPPKIAAFLRGFLGDGLIIVEGDRHKFLRKNTMPAFAFRHIKDLYPMMWDKASLLMRTLEKDVGANSATGSSVVELTTWASKVTLDIIGIAGLGRRLNTVEKDQDPLQQTFEEILEPSREKLLFSAMSFVFGPAFVSLLPWRMNNVFRELAGSLESICRPMLVEKREAIAKKQDDHFDVLSLLIKSNNFSDTELKDQLLTFLAAGHETTASALTWACYLLAKHPELQDKLRQEVEQNLPSDPSSSAGQQPADLAGILEQLPFLNGVINETLRLYPTVPLTMRTALQDTRVGDQFIPKGSSLVISIWLINRSPEIWGPDAAEIRPERWISADGKPSQSGGTGSNYDFLTFLHGPRSCIGQGFAKAEMRCLLAAMVAAFSWELAMNDGRVVPRGVITIKPENGMYLRLRPLRR